MIYCLYKDSTQGVWCSRVYGAVWCMVQYGVWCSMESGAVWCLVKYGVWCSMESAAVWSLVQCSVWWSLGILAQDITVSVQETRAHKA